MKMLKKVTVLLLSVLLTGVCLAGCGTRKTDVRYVIGVSLANLSEQWRLVLKNELETEAQKHEGVRLVTMDAAGDSKKQSSDVEKLLKFGVDLLIVSPCDVEALTPTISEAYREVPVIVMDRAVEGYDYSLFIGPDNQLIGRQAAQSVISLLEKNSASDGTVLELTVEGSSSESRSTEFTKELVAAGVHTNSVCLKNPTRDCTEDMLLENPQLLDGVQVIFAHNDYMAYGAHKALEKLGMEGIQIVGLDGFAGENGGLKLVEQGIIDATVTCPTGGTEAIQYGLDIIGHKSGIPKQIILRSHQIWPDNVQAYQREKESPAAPLGDKEIRVGHAQIREDSRWREATTASVTEAAKQFGIELSFAFNDLSVEQQREQVREFIDQGVDVIAISPVVANGWENVLQEAKDAGIPVLLVDRSISDADIYAESFIGADFEEEGRRCARWMMEETVKWQNVRILELRGTDGASPAEARKKGFQSAIAENPKYQIVCSECADFSREDAYQAVKQYLENRDWDIDVIFAHNDDMAIGAIEALKEHGIQPGVDVKIVSVDGTSDALKALQRGEINCVVECNPLLGPQLMKAITDLSEGKELPLRIITDEMVFTKDTPQVFFENRKY